MNRENTKNKNFFISFLILAVVTWGINYLRNLTIGNILFNIINDTFEYNIRLGNLIYSLVNGILLGSITWVVIAILFIKLWEKKRVKVGKIIFITCLANLIYFLVYYFLLGPFVYGVALPILMNIIYYLTLILWTVIIINVHREKEKSVAINSRNGNSEVVTETYGVGYFSLAGHILLLFFTMGIWLLVWTYRTTKYLNSMEIEYRNPVTKLLLCMFVPFYNIYWTYKSALIIDKYSKKTGVPCDISVVCLILAIFVPIIPPILIQYKINNITVH